MSELIQQNDNCDTIRWKLLTGVSALVLTAYVSSTALAKADDADRPTLWIELGGQMEMPQGLSAPFTAPFMSANTPIPDVYQGNIFVSNQRPARFSFGDEGKVTFQPEDSDWLFSAGVRYGRSHAKRHKHEQDPALGAVPTFSTLGGFSLNGYFTSAALGDARVQQKEQHAVLDFTAGKDVGLGMFGQHGSSTIEGGVRFASFTTNTSVYLSGRPNINLALLFQTTFSRKYFPTFHQYTMVAHAARSFKGIGPTVSWNASAVLAGNEHDGELALDWGINAAVLFGRQKAKTDHRTQAYHQVNGTIYVLSYRHPSSGSNHSTRSRSVTVPNIGGYAGLSFEWTNAKISFGYRVDSFFGAMDTGIDTAKKSNVSFNGPFASISVGVGD